MNGLITQSAKERIAQAKHRSKVLQKVALDLSKRYVRALEKALVKQGLLSIYSRDPILVAMDSVHARMMGELADLTSYDQYSAEVRQEEMREAFLLKLLEEDKPVIKEPAPSQETTPKKEEPTPTQEAPAPKEEPKKAAPKKRAISHARSSRLGDSPSQPGVGL